MWFLDLLADLFPLLLAGGRTRPRGSLDELTRRHPRSTVRRAELVEGWADTIELQDIVFVLGSRRGLSFRDGYGHEELVIPSGDILSLDVLSAPGDDGQHVRVAGTGGTIVEFWSSAEAGDVSADLTAALRG